jgi:outer membrane protein, multidrug efflux system
VARCLAMRPTQKHVDLCIARQPSRPLPRLRGFGIFAATAALTGCVVGPNYHPPRPNLPDRFVERGESAGREGGATASEIAWWRSFDDATLNKMIAEAQRSAPDIAESEARLREARALEGIAVAARYPTVEATGAYARNHGSENVPVGVPPGGLGPGVSSNLWQAGFDASWEIDVFGAQRRTVESASAAYQAAQAERADVELSLLAEVARTYMELRGSQRRLAVARENLAIQQDSLQLTESLLGAGLTSNLDVWRARAQVADTQAAIPALQAEARASIYRLGALIGHAPEELVGELEQPGPIPASIPAVPVGLPSDLLLRRPDIRSAERRLAAANARIGIARADLYPHFSLTGVAGLESLSADSLLNGSSRYFSVGPGIRWLIFDTDKVRFQISEEEARTDQARAAYERSVLEALRDVETSLVRCAQTLERRQKLGVEAEAERQAVDLATRLYRNGLTDYLSVLDAQRALQTAEDQLALQDRDSAVALVSLYKALGGGWQHAP